MALPTRSVPAPLLTATAALLLLSACGSPAEPTALAAPHTRSAISQGLHFFWLPPTVPVTPAFTGPFASGLLTQGLRVDVCELADPTIATPTCSYTVAHFTGTEGTGGALLAENTTSPSYRATWLSSTCDRPSPCPPLSTTKIYRMTASVDTKQLGFIDIKVVADLIAQQKVDRSQYVPLIVGRPLGIAFRVEQGY